MTTRHPLQRLQSPSRTLSLLLHLLGLAAFGLNFRFLLGWETIFSDAYGWHFQFFTIIGLALSAACFGLGALADLTGSSGAALFRLKNAVAVVAAPLEAIITLLYWGLMALDPKLLAPEDFHIPLAYDLGFHVAPAVFLALDLVLFSPPWTIPAYGILSISTVFAFAYWYWVELCYSHNEWYPYPIFSLLSTGQRALLFAFSALLCTASSSGLKWVYAKVNGYEAAQKEAHKPLKKIQ